MPQSADMPFSLILPICDSAAAQASQEDCWGLLYFTGEQTTFSSFPMKKTIIRRVGTFSYPWMEANKLCWDGKRLAGLRVPSPAPAPRAGLWMQHSLRQLSKPLGRHGHNKSLGIKAAAEEVAGEGQ